MAMALPMLWNLIRLATMASIPTLASSSSSSSFFTTSPAFLTAYRSISQKKRKSSFMMMLSPPSKESLYNDDELFQILSIHQALTTDDEEYSKCGGSDESVLGNSDGSLHDWVLQTLKNDCEVDNSAKEEVTEFTNRNEPPLDGIYEENNNDSSIEISEIPNLHKFVLQSIGDISSSSSLSPSSSNLKEGDSITISTNQIAFENLQTLLRERKPCIRAIATDVDGTLLSGQYMHPITQDAVLRGIQQAYYDESSSSSSSSSSNVTTMNKIHHFLPATGKSRKGAMLSLGPIIGPLLKKCPGVYIQGLYCVDRQGNVVFEKRLSSAAIRAAEELVSTFGMSIVGYDGDELYTTEQTDAVRELSEVYGEPTVELLVDKKTHSAIKLAEHDRGLHKLLLMDNDREKLALVRVSLEELAKKNDATVTQAIPTMLELLPAGCSKANGVQRVCEALGINPSTELLALGDAENDMDMLRMACIGVAVANACPLARDAADFIMRERHDEGGAGLAMNMFAFDE